MTVRLVIFLGPNVSQRSQLAFGCIGLSCTSSAVIVAWICLWLKPTEPKCVTLYHGHAGRLTVSGTVQPRVNCESVVDV